MERLLGSSEESDHELCSARRKWESAIVDYLGPDPLDLWYNFICWYEQNAQYDPERLLETALGKCLSIFEYQQHYHQDARIVKLWMKYVSIPEHPLQRIQLTRVSFPD